jgi:hypothetical protein
VLVPTVLHCTTYTDSQSHTLNLFPSLMLRVQQDVCHRQVINHSCGKQLSAGHSVHHISHQSVDPTPPCPMLVGRTRTCYIAACSAVTVCCWGGHSAHCTANTLIIDTVEHPEQEVTKHGGCCRSCCLSPPTRCKAAALQCCHFQTAPAEQAAAQGAMGDTLPKHKAGPMTC